MKLIVWGTGNDYTLHRDKLSGHEVILVDSNDLKQGKMLDGKLIMNPNIIRTTKYDCIIVATSKFYDEVSNILISEYNVPQNKIFVIDDIEKELLMYKIGHKQYPQEPVKKRIMFGYCFLIFENCRIHDFLLAESLRTRGAEIIPVSCGGLQEMQCSVYGGFWGNNNKESQKRKEQHLLNCKKCVSFDKKVWEQWGNYNLVDVSQNLTYIEKGNAREYVDKLDMSCWKEWEYKGYPIGIWAAKTYYNNYLISNKKCFDKQEEKIFRDLVYNVIIICIASEKAIDLIKPDIIYSNDSFYYPYIILEVIAKKKNIPFYNAYGYRKDTYSYAKNEATLNFPLSDAWTTFSKKNLAYAEERFIDSYIQNRKYGKDMMINTANPQMCIDELNKKSIYGKIDINKKTALMATNITWDAAALFRETIFESIQEWVLNTIEYFEQNEQWQLIIRCHPAEIAKILPQAQERISELVLNKYNNKLPSNIILVDSDAPISIYDLLPYVSLGIVYTTTAGLEMSCMGIPVITVGQAPYRGKGFTFEPQDKEDYYQKIEDVLRKNEKIENIELLAKKFLLLYYFVYMLPNPFYEYSHENGAKMYDYNENILEYGRNPAWDYICDSIMEEKDILSADRFPPYDVEE